MFHTKALTPNFFVVIDPLSPKTNQHDVAAKTLVVLDRIAEALRVKQWAVGKDHGLTPLQMKTLQFIDYHAHREVTVSMLSENFRVSKPTISETIRILHHKELVAKERSINDGRSFRLRLLDQGESILRRVSVYGTPFWEVLKRQSDEAQHRLYADLYRVLNDLQIAGLIPLQGSCTNCRYLSVKEESSYCNLFEKPMLPTELRVDCPEFSRP